MTAARQTAMSPDEALQKLKDGNARFVRGEELNRDYSAQVEATAEGQYPFAMVLGCVDSRAPAELLFDVGFGDIFKARVAGNFVNDDVPGSIEFATRVAGAPLILVMGHTSCGAVKGACENVQLGHVSSLVNEIRPSVEAVTPEGETCSASNAELVDKVAAHNVDRTIAEIRNESAIIAELEAAGEVKIVGAMYDISTGVVQFYE
ncbi:carbonic anhydrase [Lujinxingia vulgaris]|uniref:Carbonic anhydrase n=2 Tax=Lujinxingia vulgaris TaxID=2600176 RepID=A0A5C6XMS9_9DELT|nr:carbonic anhydrase [Lujinxingia vulgaris]